MINCPTLKIMVFNSHSLRNKTYGICEFLTENNCDLCFVTEAWLNLKDKAIVAEVKDLGFEIKFQPRKGSKRGGGVCVLYKPDLTVEKCTVKPSYRSVEILQITVKSSYNLYRISTFYRTGALSLNSRADFMTDFNDYLGSLVHLKGENILCGDFNIHVNEKSNKNKRELYSITESFGYEQLVEESTHRDGNTLDLLFIQSSGTCKQLATQSVYVYDLCYSLSSDHKFIECMIPFIKDPVKSLKETRMYRNFNNINTDQFCSDIKMLLESSCTNTFTNLNVDDAVKCFNGALRQVVDRHAPLVTKCYVSKRTPFTTSKILSLRRERRRYERRYRKYRKQSDLKKYDKLKKDVEQCVRRTRNTYYQNGLSKKEGNKRETFKLLLLMICLGNGKVTLCLISLVRKNFVMSLKNILFQKLAMQEIALLMCQVVMCKLVKHSKILFKVSVHSP